MRGGLSMDNDFDLPTDQNADKQNEPCDEENTNVEGWKKNEQINEQGANTGGWKDRPVEHSEYKPDWEKSQDIGEPKMPEDKDKPEDAETGDNTKQQVW